VALSTNILLQPPTPTPSSGQSPSQTPLSVTFFSASSIPLALPPIIACGFGWPKWGLGVVGVNERVSQWLLGMFVGGARDSHSHPRARLFESKAMKVKEGRLTAAVVDKPRVRGWAFMDFYEDPAENGVVPLLVECNFRGRTVGEEGWI
jgi:1-phosphatidylinositol phosphodiesterase